MGQKVNPRGLRIGVIYNWNTQWYANKDNFATYLKEDSDIRKYIKSKYNQYLISKIEISRAANKLNVTIYAVKSKALIGGDESNVRRIEKEIAKIVNPNKAVKSDTRVEKVISVNVLEVKKPDMDAQVVAETIATGLENRNNNYKKVMRQAMGRARKASAEGIKVKLSGRINGAEQASSEIYSDGSVPLQTLRADVDYGFAEAHTTYGLLGIKVWIYKGEKFTKSRKEGGND